MLNPRFAVRLVCLIGLVTPSVHAQDSPVDALSAWLAMTNRPALGSQPWATQPLTRDQAQQAGQMLWDRYLEQIRDERHEEWDNKVIRLDDLQMKFEYKTFGQPGPDGRRLFISMHGGGGAPPRVNERQWQNQIGLYEPEEGIYLAPRAPTDTWNLWHQPHIDRFFERLIQDAVVFANVDPNRVYIMGYSAGGDGVYQLAPRMADHLAAAAMMAGHPNDASPLGLRNIGFTLHMGADDKAYNRNQVAADWKQKLADLQQADPQGYRHEVVIHEGKGHWMDRQDAVAVGWMSGFQRDPYPAQIVWQIKGPQQRQFYWLALQDPLQDPQTAGLLKVSLNSQPGKQTITFLEGDTDHVTLRLNDQMLDLDQPVTVQSASGGKSLQKKLDRTIATLYQTLQERGDRSYMFSAEWKLGENN